ARTAGRRNVTRTRIPASRVARDFRRQALAAAAAGGCVCHQEHESELTPSSSFHWPDLQRDCATTRGRTIALCQSAKKATSANSFRPRQVRILTGHIRGSDDCGTSHSGDRAMSRRGYLTLCLVFCFGLGCSAARSHKEPPPELVVTNAHVLTMNPSQPSADAMAIAGDRILWIGSDDAARRRYPEATRLD